jgi:type IV pilus assembly protein PilY1
MGQTWSQPRLTKVNDNGVTKVVAIIAGGYDKNEDLRYGQTQTFPTTTDDNIAGGSSIVDPQLDDGSLLSGSGKTSPDGATQHKLRGNAIYAIEVATLQKVSDVYSPLFNQSGTVFWSYDDNDNPKMTYSFPSNVTLISQADNYAEKFYIGDTGGRMWRFDVSDPDKSNWGGEIIFDANEGTGTDVGRKFFYPPAAAIIGGKTHLWFGSGDRAHPLNHAVVDRLYYLADNGQDDDTVGDYIDEERLVDLTTDPLQSGDAATVALTLNKLHNNSAIQEVVDDPGYPFYGWMIKMNQDHSDSSVSTVVGEKMLATPVMFNSEAYYTTYTPKVDPTVDDPCAVGNLGDSRLYHLSALTGEAVFNYDITNDDTDLSANPDSRAQGKDGAVLLRSDRSRSLGEGIPSGVVTLIDASGRVTMMVSASNRVETYNAPDVKLISPVYWMEW